MTSGGGGVSQKVILHDEGGGVLQTTPKKDDIICEQPLNKNSKVKAKGKIPSFNNFGMAPFNRF